MGNIIKVAFFLIVLISNVAIGSTGTKSIIASEADTVAGNEIADSIRNDRSMNPVVIDAADTVVFVETDTTENRPNRAAFLSAALPGLGQAYNGSYYKIPIIYGGVSVAAFFLQYNHKLYTEFRDNYLALKDGDDRTDVAPIYSGYDISVYERYTEIYRKNRDRMIIAMVVIYALNIVDAHVEAHLKDFVINEDLSINIGPAIHNTGNTNTFALGLTINF